ncbi:MAG: hypothetical protein ABWY27_09790 [Telluria sp.]
MFTKYTGLALAAGLLSTAAHAQIALTADLGSTGAGLHLVAPISAGVNGRVGANYTHYSFKEKHGSIHYEIKGKLQTIDLLLDYYPLSGSALRLTTGALYNGNRFAGQVVGNGTAFIKVNGTTYNIWQVGAVYGDINFRKAAPYLGIGWGNALTSARRWNFSADLGAFYQGKPKVTLVNEGCSAAAAVCTALAQDIQAEKLRFQEDAAPFFPVLRVGVSYRF